MNFLIKLNQCSDTFDRASQEWISEFYDCIQLNKLDYAVAISEQLLDRADQLLRSEIFKDVSFRLRSQYEVASLMRALILLVAHGDIQTTIKECMKLLDMALLMTGCPNYKEKVFEMISDLNACLIMIPLNPSKVNAHLHDIPIVRYQIESRTAMSLADFKICHNPFVLKNSVNFWPAISSRSWGNLEYLNHLAGHRLIPVEIGSSYTHRDWTQKIIPFHEFLASLTDSTRIVYLAQFDLLGHVKELENDIAVPDYCYMRESEEPIINIWMGPKSTVSPCHHDPYDNILVQIFGYKYIRLYHPDFNLYPYPPDQMLSNTSQIDVEFLQDLSSFPDFPKNEYLDIVLGPGDMLFIPKGWWHYVRSLSVSFSISFWF